MTAFSAKPEVFEWEHVARAIQTTWRTQCPGACAMLCELALKRFEPTAELYTQLGMCQWAVAEEAPSQLECRRWAAKAAASFAAARPLGEQEPGYVFRVMALLSSNDGAGALAELDLVLAHPKFREKWKHSEHAIRARIHLMKGDAAKALEECDAAIAAKENWNRDDKLFAIRALALAGRTDEAIEKATAAYAADPWEGHLTLLVDVLAFAGKHDEALALLAKHPAEKGKQSDEGFAALQRSRAALAYLIGLRGKRPADLRQQLVKVLGLQVKVGNVDGLLIHRSTDEKDSVDMNASPHAIAAFASSQHTCAYTWALDALFVASVQDAPAWQQDALGLALLERILADQWQDITGEHAVDQAKTVLAAHRIMPYAEGVLTAGKLLGL